MVWSSKFSATHIPFVTLMYRKPYKVLKTILELKIYYCTKYYNSDIIAKEREKEERKEGRKRGKSYAFLCKAANFIDN